MVKENRFRLWNLLFTYRNYYEKIDNRLIQCDEIVGFSIPNNWAFSYISQVSSYGFTCLNRKILKGDWLLELEDIKCGLQELISTKYIDEKTNLNSKVSFYKDMILYSKLRPYLDKVLIAKSDGVATSEIVPFWVFINNQYLVMFYRTPYFLNKVTNLMYGVKMPRLGTSDMRNTIVPIPPLNEQTRIIKKLDLINQLLI